METILRATATTKPVFLFEVTVEGDSLPPLQMYATDESEALRVYRLYHDPGTLRVKAERLESPKRGAVLEPAVEPGRSGAGQVCDIRQPENQPAEV